MLDKFLLSFAALFLTSCLAISQEIPQSQVPSLIVNKFHLDHPSARDIDWELRDGIYEVEFEIGYPEKDHKIRYNASGEILYHKQEISRSDLPDNLRKILRSEFPNHRIKDIKQIDESGKTIYSLEAKSLSKEWEVLMDSEGNILSKHLD